MKRFLVLVLMILVASCSKNLSRDHAKEKLVKHFSSVVLTNSTNIGVIHGQFGAEKLNKVSHPCVALYEDPAPMDRLIDGGFLSVNRTAYHVEQTWLYTIVTETCDFELTDEGQKYVVDAALLQDGKDINDRFKDRQGKIVVFNSAHRIIESVDGVTAPSDLAGRITCTVNYTYKNVCNPVATSINPDLVCNDPLKDTATFILYDDGWRLEGANEKSDADKDLNNLTKLWDKLGHLGGRL